MERPARALLASIKVSVTFAHVDARLLTNDSFVLASFDFLFFMKIVTRTLVAGCVTSVFSLFIVFENCAKAREWNRGTERVLDALFIYIFAGALSSCLTGTSLASPLKNLAAH